MWALGPHSLAGHYLQRSEKEKEKMNKQDSSSLENYDVRPSHKASDKIRLDPSGSILIAAFRLNRHSPQVQNNLENLFWLLSCVPASPVCFGLWSVTQRKEMLVARRLHTEEGDARGTQVALTYERAWGLNAPLLSWCLGQPPLFPLGGIQQQERAGYWVGPRVPPWPTSLMLWRVTWKECAVHLMGVTRVQITFWEPICSN